MYKIIFGLEMLGNPVGFVTGLKDGAIGLFYYPIQVSQINITCPSKYLMTFPIIKFTA